MAYNFIGLVNEVNRRLNEVEITNTSAAFVAATGFYNTAKDVVNASIRHIQQEEFGWPFNHIEEEETLAVGITRYSYPEDAKSINIDSFRLKRNDTLGIATIKLKAMDYQEYLNKHIDYEYNTSTALRGVPRFIIRAPSDEFIIIPTPDKAYELVYEYYRNPIDLELYNDVPNIPKEFKYVIVEGAMYYAYQFRGDVQNAQLSQQKFQTGIKHMRSLYINRYEYIRSTAIEQGSISNNVLRVS